MKLTDADKLALECLKNAAEQYVLIAKEGKAGEKKWVEYFQDIFEVTLSAYTAACSNLEHGKEPRKNAGQLGESP